jgi:hypothetical protein
VLISSATDARRPMSDRTGVVGGTTAVVASVLPAPAGPDAPSAAEGRSWALAGGAVISGGVVIDGDLQTASSPIVLLELTFLDEVLGLDGMRFSTDGGATWTAWEAFDLYKELVLPAGDGVKTVLVEVRDADGNVATASDDILLDTSGPTITSSVVDGTVLDLLQKVLFLFAATDGSGLASLTATLDGIAISSGTTLDAGLMLAGVHVITITATDALGNVSEMLIHITVRASIGSLISKFNEAVGRGLVHSSQKNALLSKLNTAAGQLEKGQTVAAKATLRSLSTAVAAERGGRVDAAWADLFISWVDDLANRL